jgi:RNAse (barnase) inhibitor barstar
MINSTKLTRPTFQCIHFIDSEVSLPKGDLDAAGINTTTVSMSQVHTKEQLLDSLAQAFRFPSYFGRNWDALDESMRDLSWMPAAGYVVCFTYSLEFWRSNTRLAGELVEISLGVAEWWSGRQVPFHVVFSNK